MMAEALDELRHKVALSCRILALTGLVKEITGHVSARVPGAQEMVIRCRGDDEYGLPFTGPRAIRRLDFDGQGPGLGEQHVAPIELPIHGEIYKARPEVSCVVHAHPPAVLLCGIAGVELRPVFGAFDPAAMALALEGIPVYPRSILISRPELGAELVGAMGNKPVCIMRGHGIAVTGRTVEEATLRAIRLENLARVCWQLARHGPLPDVSAEDVAEFGGQAGAVVPRGDEWVWRYYVRLVEDKRSLADESVLTPLS
jgi:ribulose-5-phosphate 4-epimerase/fuculose-1-phosphate aldolase